jgi:metal-responsive CopG/Arc/MetJ family transcriptional regulator
MRLNVDLKEDLYRRFSDAADRRGRSISDLVRQLLWEYVEKETEQLIASACDLEEDHGRSVDARG